MKKIEDSSQKVLKSGGNPEIPPKALDRDQIGLGSAQALNQAILAFFSEFRHFCPIFLYILRILSRLGHFQPLLFLIARVHIIKFQTEVF